ncbi:MULTISPECIES: DNA polymerase IV [Rhodomicrobium]|uniref:DNA polymerase IV n=1 Tax=Rhodomicrobium TaxID=1068 RepID=UPI00148258CA|nr:MULTISPECIES: DNA polymerase IV [Rhodomicrobium]
MLTQLCRDCCQLVAPRAGSCPDCGGERRIAHAELAALTIAHIDCDAFYASVEKRDRPDLREKPLIVGHDGGRGVVTTACYIARRYGVRSAMPMFKALDLCPDAVVLPPDMGKYKAVSDDIRAIFRAATEVIEPVSLDEAYLDLTEAHESGERAAAEALAVIALRVEREVGITVSIGLSCNKFLAKLASEMDKPRGFSVIGAAEAKAVLAPMSIRKINGVGQATAQRLEASGIASIGQLQALSEMQLVTQYGKFGRRLARYAQGEDERAVTPDRPTKSISAETTFSRDTGSADELIAVARRLGERVATQLQRKGLAGGAVVLKLKTSDFRLLTRSKRLPNATQRASVLAEAAEFLIRRDADGRRFRLIGVGVDDLRPATEADPPGLFDMA